MKLMIKPHKDACVLAAFAMAAGVTLEYLIGVIGHDGTGIVHYYRWTEDGYMADDLGEEIAVGFHIQEIIGPLVLGGMAITPIELGPVSQLNTSYHSTHAIYFPNEQGNWDRFNRHIKKTRNGVLTGECGKVGHAVAVDGIEGKIYDPDGEVFDYSVENLLSRGFKPMCLWKVQNV